MNIKNNRIKELLQDLNLTQEKFGQELGITQSQVSKILNGHPLSKTLGYLIQYRFGYSFDWLCGKETEKLITYRLIDLHKLDDAHQQLITLSLSLGEEDVKKVLAFIHAAF